MGKQFVQFQTEDMVWSKVMPFYDFLKSKNEDPQTIWNYHKSLLLFIEFHLLYTNLYTDDNPENDRIIQMERFCHGIKRKGKEAHEC
jgi:hypothetical protein